MPLRSHRGPRPLRSRDAPFEPLLHLTDKEKAKCWLSTYLMLITLDLMCEGARHGCWLAFEHPSDPEDLVTPSIWNTELMRNIIADLCLCARHLHQCRYGLEYMKPTTILCTPRSSRGLLLRCNHRGRHKIMLGTNSKDEFYSTAASSYPPSFVLL